MIDHRMMLHISLLYRHIKTLRSCRITYTVAACDTSMITKHEGGSFLG